MDCLIAIQIFLSDDLRTNNLRCKTRSHCFNKRPKKIKKDVTATEITSHCKIVYLHPNRKTACFRLLGRVRNRIERSSVKYFQKIVSTELSCLPFVI